MIEKRVLYDILLRVIMREMALINSAENDDPSTDYDVLLRCTWLWHYVLHFWIYCAIF